MSMAILLLAIAHLAGLALFGHLLLSRKSHASLILWTLWLLLCHAARERLDVFTPYFVPNEHLLVTLEIAAARGVRVRLMIPTLNEHMYMVDADTFRNRPLGKKLRQGFVRLFGPVL